MCVFLAFFFFFALLAYVLQADEVWITTAVSAARYSRNYMRLKATGKAFKIVVCTCLLKGKVKMYINFGTML